MKQRRFTSGETRAHYLRSTRNDAKPTNVVCLGADLATIKRTGEGAADTVAPMRSVHVDQLYWSRWRFDGGEMSRYTTRTAYSPAHFWADLRTQCRSDAVLWVFGFGLYQTLGAMGLWELIDAGRLIVDGRDPQAATPSGQADDPDFRGVLITENPPTILILAHADHPGTIKFVDLANYGFEGPAPDASGQESLLTSIKAVQSYYLLLTEFDLGAWQHTAASQSFHSFKRRFMTGRIQCHAFKEILDLERNAYFPGRCEAYYIGDLTKRLHGTLYDALAPAGGAEPRLRDRVYQLDINASYLAATVNEEMPAELVAVTQDVDPTELLALCTRFAAIADVDIETPGNDYPCRLDSTVVWPVGRFRTVLCAAELIHALSLGRVCKVHEAALYERRVVFDAWSHGLWDIRRAVAARQDSPILPVVKRLGLSLFGKMGQYARRWVRVPDRVNESRWDAWAELDPSQTYLTQWRCVAGRVEYQAVEGFAPEACPALAAYTTSLGRSALWSLVVIAGRDSVYYVDTDSLWVDDVGYARLRGRGLVDPDRLGGLKMAGEYSQVEIRGLKHYLADGRLVCAGLPRDTSLNSEWAATVEEAEPLGAALQAKRAPRPLLIARRKQWRREYRHGRVAPDGTVRPLKLGDW